MKRLPLLIVLTALILALGGLGAGDRLAVRRAVADGAAMAGDIARQATMRFRAWRSDRSASEAADQAGTARPVGGSGLILSGVYRAQHQEAAARLGEAEFEGAAIRFSRGLSVHTGPERIALASDSWSTSGRAFATLASGPDTAQIEIRRITKATLPDGQDVGCGPGVAPTWVAIRQRPGDLDLMLFSGVTPPGPGMAETALCGAWPYDAKD